MNTELDKPNLLDLFTDGSSQPVASTTRIVWAENLSFGVLSAGLPESDSKGMNIPIPVR